MTVNFGKDIILYKKYNHELKVPVKYVIVSKIKRTFSPYNRGRLEEVMTLQQLKYVIEIANCGSMNEAAKRLYLSQPSLSGAIKELEEEIGLELFFRSNRGIVISPAGEDFLSYARQVTEQYRLLEDRYIKRETKKHFRVSTQHYSFAVKAFVEMVKEVGMEEYELAIHETRTYEIIEAVKNYQSELGILYLNSFNEQVMKKTFRELGLEFTEILTCDTYVYLWAEHPLANQSVISMKELEEYPCLAFDQGKNNSFYLSEEMMSTYDYKRMIKANDRATMLNLMIGLNGYTLCSGIICEELNGDAYKAVKLKESETMRIGYLMRKGTRLSSIGTIYLDKIREYIAKYQSSI